MAWTRARQASQAGDTVEALRWMERAHRLLPEDELITLTLGSLRLAGGDPAGAVALLEPLSRTGTAPAAWTALGAALLALGEVDGALSAIEQGLHRAVVTPELAVLAERVVGLGTHSGWCGLDAGRRLRFGTIPPEAVLLDGRAIAASDPLEGGEAVVVTGRCGEFLGSPLPIRRLCAMEGFVAEIDNRLQGWAWHPGDPDRHPTVTLRGPLGTLEVTPDEAADGIPGLPPLARPRRFTVDLAMLGSPVSTTDGAGRHLLGSPIWRKYSPKPLVPALPRIDRRRRPVDVVMPVYGNADGTLAALAAVLASLPPETVVHVVDDASPDPELATALDDLAQAGRIRLHRHAKNRGFPGAANTGLRAAAGRDVVLLNSDAVVPPGWLERLRAAAYAAPEIGSATPLSDDGTIVSYRGAGDPVSLDAVAQAANAGLIAELPVGVGFCLYIRRDCLDQVGALREELFAQGYGEESDFCLRARRCGWRHVAALDVFVAHHGGRSFGAGRTDLRRRNQAILERHHPDYRALVDAHLMADPLFAARRRMDSLLWAGQRRDAAVVMVSHGEGGGVAELVAERSAALRMAQVRPIVLLPSTGGCRIDGFDDLRFAVPAELPELAALLRQDRPTHLELHHLLGHEHGVLEVAALLNIPVDIWVHDASLFCPRVALIGRERRYCGEPAPTVCAACVDELGSNLNEPIAVDALIGRSARDLVACRRVVAPTEDTARRIRRHFPAVRPVIVPWEDDAALPPLDRAPPAPTTRICAVGAIGVEKGYDLLLGCAEDARRRHLPLEFVVCGHTEDDERLMAAGPVFVTGRYAAAEAVGLIRQQRAQLAFIPSIWPETWCFALSRAWQAGLPAVAFDLGAPGERIRATRRGHLLPLGLPVARINDALLRLAPASAGLQP